LTKSIDGAGKALEGASGGLEALPAAGRLGAGRLVARQAGVDLAASVGEEAAALVEAGSTDLKVCSPRGERTRPLVEMPPFIGCQLRHVGNLSLELLGGGEGGVVGFEGGTELADAAVARRPSRPIDRRLLAEQVQPADEIRSLRGRLALGGGDALKASGVF